MEGHILAIPDQDDLYMTPMRGPSEPEELTIPALVDSASLPDLEADLALSDSTDSDLVRSVGEELLQLHREGRMSRGSGPGQISKLSGP